MLDIIKSPEQKRKDQMANNNLLVLALTVYFALLKNPLKRNQSGDRQSCRCRWSSAVNKKQKKNSEIP